MAVSARPFHHGNLRVTLLDQAEVVLRERGIEALSLRELAREAGVSHGAPRSHFIDRNALLDALAERGLYRLADQIRTASGMSQNLAESLLATGLAYLKFAEEDPALLELMVTAKADAPSDNVRAAGRELLAAMTIVVARGVDAGLYKTEQVPGLVLLLSATARGIASLVASRNIDTSTGETLMAVAVERFVTGR